MWTNIGLEKCISFIECGYVFKPDQVPTQVRPAITISRMAGAGGHTVASHLAEYLQANIPGGPCEWTVFDRNLVEKILEEHHHHKGIAKFMQEGHKTMFTDAVEENLGLHPGSWTLTEHTNATIRKLARMGNVIIVGRGANIVTMKLPNAFHVRLVGSVEKRLKLLQKLHKLDEKAAMRFLKKEDGARRQYLKDHFDKDIDDPLLYHILINIDLVPLEEAARMIGNEVIRRFDLCSRAKLGATQRIQA
jgi:cytidylate kinase